jgi:BirA family transcriptional regulator, biotin operon repressor / biotin---[acetyl-CoA-carboxylase] ligase
MYSSMVSFLFKLVRVYTLSMPSPHLPPLLIPLLKRMSDGKFHSGQALAADYAVSRATVFNLIRQAEKLGLRIHAVQGRGYRLADPFAWLDEPVLRSELAATGHGYTLATLTETDSTNTRLLEHALGGAPHRTVLYADYQHAGRGRRGREWQAPLGGGLAFSVLWRFDCGISQLSGLSIAIGLALARALARFCPPPIKLKWPNDVLAGYRKLAGILVEVQGELSGPSFAVIGVGVNQHLPAHCREEIDQAVVDLVELGVHASRVELMAAILSELAEVMAQFEQGGIKAILPQWPDWHAHEGREVVLRAPDGTRHTGLASGLDEAGNLLLKMQGGEVRKFGAGEVSLRPVST